MLTIWFRFLKSPSSLSFTQPHCKQCPRSRAWHWKLNKSELFPGNWSCARSRFLAGNLLSTHFKWTPVWTVAPCPACDFPASSWPPSKGPRCTLVSVLSLADRTARCWRYSFKLSHPPRSSSVCRSLGLNQIIAALPKPSLIPEVGMLAAGARSVCSLKMSPCEVRSDPGCPWEEAWAAAEGVSGWYLYSSLPGLLNPPS